MNDPRRLTARYWLFAALVTSLMLAWQLTGAIPAVQAQSAPSKPGDSKPERPKRTGGVKQLLEDGGTIGVIILLLSVVSLGFIIEHSITIRRSRLMPQAVIEELEPRIKARKIDEAVRVCQDPLNDSLLTNVVLAGLLRFKSSEFGFAEYRTAVEEAGEEQTAKLYRKTEVLSVIGAIAPMLGLLGTVQGMIEAFETIAATEGAAKPADLAGSISKALVTTLEGLIVAIPTLAALSFFRTRIDSLVAETGKKVEHLLMPLGRMR